MPPPAPSSPPSPAIAPVPHGESWTAQLAWRARRLLALKLVGITGFTWVFFIAYFHLLRHPASPVAVMPLTALDRLIPFQPLALYAYFSLWLYVGIAPGLQRGFTSLVVYGLWSAALCAAGLAVFYVWPNAVPPFALPDVSGVPGFAILQGVDAAGNACPSMHVAVATFAVLRIGHLLREVGAPAWPGAINLGWFLAIVWSTLAIKQHVVLDVLAGGVLGVAFALASLRWRPARQAAAPPAAAMITSTP